VAFIRLLWQPAIQPDLKMGTTSIGMHEQSALCPSYDGAALHAGGLRGRVVVMALLTLLI
jgi:hypothetical protein